MIHYVLDEAHQAVPADLHTWAKFFQNFENRRVARTEINDEVHVSTVFLGTDHNWSGVGPPLLFETMVFGGPDNQWMDRYSTWEQAEAAHLAIVAALEGGLRLSDVEDAGTAGEVTPDGQ